MTVSVKDIAKGIAFVGCTIGAAVAVQHKMDEYTEEHGDELETVWGLTKGIGYMLFMDGLYAAGSAIAYGMLCETIDAYAMLGEAFKTAAKAVSTTAV